MVRKFNPGDYGVVRERSEGTLYLMRRCSARPGWAEEVAHRLDSGWYGVQEGQSRYMVLEGDVTWAVRKNKSELSKILDEIDKNSKES